MTRGIVLGATAVALAAVLQAGCGGSEESSAGAAETPKTSTEPTTSESASPNGRATLAVRSTEYGRVLFDGNGRVLYAFTRDEQGAPSRCYGGCAKAWPVYFAPTELRAGEGVDGSLIGTTERRDGRLQVTYDGWPLYYYEGEGPGEVKCQGVDNFGGLWLVVRPSGELVQ
jgi:predicted lipoprotein with Yx(FWY)xxD motif